MAITVSIYTISAYFSFFFYNENICIKINYLCILFLLAGKSDSRQFGDTPIQVSSYKNNNYYSYILYKFYVCINEVIALFSIFVPIVE